MRQKFGQVYCVCQSWTYPHSRFQITISFSPLKLYSSPFPLSPPPFLFLLPSPFPISPFPSLRFPSSLPSLSLYLLGRCFIIMKRDKPEQAAHCVILNITRKISIVGCHRYCYEYAAQAAILFSSTAISSNRDIALEYCIVWNFRGGKRSQV